MSLPYFPFWNAPSTSAAVLRSFFPGYEHIADPLIDMADYGMRAATIKQIFAELRQGLIPLIEQITGQPPVDDSCLHQFFPEAQQWAFWR